MLVSFMHILLASASTSGMSGGAIAGVVLGTLFLLLIVAFLGAFLVRSGKIPMPMSRASQPSSQSPPADSKAEDNGFDNALYFNKDESES